MKTTCQYFALCTNTAVGVVANAFLGPVPCCTRCATRMDLQLQPFGN